MSCIDHVQICSQILQFEFLFWLQNVRRESVGVLSSAAFSWKNKTQHLWDEGSFGMTSYPCQGFLDGYHILLHHHHQLDTLFIAHGDFTGHKTNVVTCQVKVEMSADGTKHNLNLAFLFNQIVNVTWHKDGHMLMSFPLCSSLTFWNLTQHSFLWLSKSLPKRLALSLSIPFSYRAQQFSLI